MDLIRAAGEMVDPQDGVDLAGLLIVGLPATLAAIGTLIVGVLTVRGQLAGRIRAQKVDAKTDAIYESTVNTHDTLLRDDVDGIRDDVQDVKRQGESTQAAVEMLAEQLYLLRHQLAEFGKDVTGLRRDDGTIRGALREESEARRDLEKRVVRAFRREHPGAEPL